MGVADQLGVSTTRDFVKKTESNLQFLIPPSHIWRINKFKNKTRGTGTVHVWAFTAMHKFITSYIFVKNIQVTLSGSTKRISNLLIGD